MNASPAMQNAIRAKQEADIRLAYSRFEAYRKHGEPVGKGAFIELSEQDAFIKAVQELLR